MIRVGRCTYEKGRRIDPTVVGYTSILVLTPCSAYGELGPYVLENEHGSKMENIWQAAKVYERVPSSRQKYSRYDSTVIWKHPAEKHVTFNCSENPDALQEALDAWTSIPQDKRGNKYVYLRDRLEKLGLRLEVQLLPAYWKWREKLEACQYAVRYPVTFQHRHKCLFAFKDDPANALDYVESRKEIYVPVYCELVKRVPKFDELVGRLKAGENLLIIEVDGPHQETMPYYQERYGVNGDFIVDSTMLATQENIGIMLNDEKHPFGHGYCLAMALLGKDKEWCT